MMLSRGPRESPPTNASAAETGIRVHSAIERSATFTASDSGFRRAPPQSGQGFLLMLCSICARTWSEVVSR